MIDPLIPIAFALSGDKTAIPTAAQPSGAISLTTGWGPDYQKDPATNPDSKPIDRGTMNWLFNLVTALLRTHQTATYPEWIDAAANGGNAFAYPKGATVRYRANAGSPWVVWTNTIDGNTASPSAPNGWVEFVYAISSILPKTGGTATGLIAFDGGATVLAPAPTDYSNRAITSAWATNKFPEIAVVQAISEIANGALQRSGGTVTGITNFVAALTATTPGAGDVSSRVPNTSWVHGGFTAFRSAGGNAEYTGYIKFPAWMGGIVLNFGATSTSAPGVVKNITYPLAFQNGQFAIGVSNFSPEAGAVANPRAWTIYSQNNTSCNIQQAAAGTSASESVASWWALGY